MKSRSSQSIDADEPNATAEDQYIPEAVARERFLGGISTQTRKRWTASRGLPEVLWLSPTTAVFRKKSLIAWIEEQARKAAAERAAQADRKAASIAAARGRKVRRQSKS